GRVMVVSSDPAGLAAELDRHLATPTLGEEMRERGAALAAEHTWGRVADLYLDMYRARSVI
ncbi:MAG: glycosyltransferase family 1 protein, partial [Armatimonadota bacterium]